MKFKKTLIIALLSIISAVCFLTAIGCKDDGAKKDVADGSLNLSFEYMTDAEIPIELFEGVTVEDMLDGNVLFRFTSPEYTEQKETLYDVYESFSPYVFCDKVGVWTVACVKGGDTVCKSFEVKDTVAPELSIPELAYDVWVRDGDDLEDLYYLPEREVFDLSEIDRKSVVETLTVTPLGSDTPENVQIMTGRSYFAKKAGKMTYTLTAADIYGNSTTITETWNVKNQEWSPETIQEGFLADYNDAGYINSVSSGKAASYWFKSAVEEEYLESFTDKNGNEASGVVKVSAPINGYAMACFKFKLFGDTTESALKNKNLVIRMLTTNVVDLRFGCQTWREVPESVHTAGISVDIGVWTKVTIPWAQLSEGYFHGDYGVQDEKINEFQICFGTYGASVLTEDAVLYIDSVSVISDSDRLSLPETVDFDGTTLSWSAVDGADAYEIYQNGAVVSTVNAPETTFAVTDATAAFGVRPIASNENVRKVSSESIMPYIDKTGFESYDIAPIDNSAYTYLFNANDFASHRKATSVTAEYLDEYKGEKGVVKVTSINNATTFAIGDIVMNLPKRAPQGLTLRMLVESSDAATIRFLQPHTEYGVEEVKNQTPMADIKVTDTWQDYFLNYANNYDAKNNDRIDIMFQGGKAGSSNVVYFAFVMDGDQRTMLKTLAFKPLQNQLATGLGEGYLADFSSADYAGLVVKSMTKEDYQPADMSVEYLTEYESEQNVIKIELTANAKGYADFLVMLPKAYSNGYTLRYYFESDTLSAWPLRPFSDTDISATGGVDKWGCLKTSAWLDVYVSDTGYTSYLDAVSLRINGTPSGTGTIYLAWVKDGNQTA